MKYTRYDLKKYHLHIIKTDRFKTVTVRINLKRKIKKEELTMRRLLSYVLIDSTAKYPTRKLIEIKTEDLYGLGGGVDFYLSGNYSILSFNSTFLNEKFTEPGMNAQSIDFLLQVLNHPNVIDGKFDKVSFDIAKRCVKDDIDSFKDYPASYSRDRMKELMNEGTPLAYRSVGYLEDLKKINPKKLYQYYKSVLENDIVDVMVIGDVDENQIQKILEENLVREKENQKSESHFVQNKEIHNPVIYQKETMNIEQSSLVMGYKFDELTDFELSYVLRVFSHILGGSGNSLLFKTIREKNSLCYTIASNYSLLGRDFSIYAGIDKENYQKTVDLTLQEIEKMKKGEFDEEEIDNAKIIFKNSCISLYDSPNSILNTYLSHEYLGSDLIEEKMKKIEEVTKDMVVKLANKIHLDTVFLLEGGIHHEESTTH